MSALAVISLIAAGAALCALIGLAVDAGANRRTARRHQASRRQHQPRPCPALRRAEKLWPEDSQIDGWELGRS
jgi:hypothetical protein